MPGITEKTLVKREQGRWGPCPDFIEFTFYVEFIKKIELHLKTHKISNNDKDCEDLQGWCYREKPEVGKSSRWREQLVYRPGEKKLGILKEKRVEKLRDKVHVMRYDLRGHSKT